MALSLCLYSWSDGSTSQCELLWLATPGFLSALLSYAGPLLLNALLKYLGQGSSHGHHNERPLEQAQPQGMSSALHSFPGRDSAAYGCCLVALLGLTAVLKVCSQSTSVWRRQRVVGTLSRGSFRRFWMMLMWQAAQMAISHARSA